MAIALEDKENTSAPTSDYPFGNIKDDSGARDGTEVNKRNHADFHQFFAKLMDLAALEYNDLPDNAYSGFQYVEALLTIVQSTLSLLELKGDLDASTNPNYPAADKGDVYVITVAGKIGGGSGKDVDVGDMVVCKVTNAGGNEGAVGVDWFVVEHNIQKASQAETDAGVNDIKYLTPAKIAGATEIIHPQQCDDQIITDDRDVAGANFNSYQIGTHHLGIQSATNAPIATGSRLFSTWTLYDVTTAGKFQRSEIVSGTDAGDVYARFFSGGSWGGWTLINDASA